MNSLERRIRRKSLKERLGFMSCCGGATWSFSNPSNISVREEEQEEEEDEFQVVVIEQEESRNVVLQIPEENVGGDQACPAELTVSGMNLATALAAERQFRATQDGGNDQVELTERNEYCGPHGIPFRISLMKLLEQSDGVDEGVGNDGMCCVCMGRRKGAAFIPCGHTFCRVCSRELWLNRGSCPICNRLILEILDIF
ncbi:hypothetical protein AQUCO_03200089v1 [Aquilegia coerulea]|uniref:RING-type domain-containing protein n=1 Tax=Aquilegia coerulea TaxID=218851 RepID=A0A2G5D059_AQUCA|nr:hypothetical protein AQUCO_03200089v1 [Aquilegia coerulea]